MYCYYGGNVASSYVGGRAYDANYNYIGVISSINRQVFITPQNCHYIKIVWATENASDTYNHDIIIAKSNQPVAYQPYNGDIIHEIDCQGVLLWKNGQPNAGTGFDPQTIYVLDMSSYRTLKFVYKLSASPDTSLLEMYVQFLTSSVFNMPSFGDEGTLHLRKVTFASSTSVTFGSGYVGSTLNNGAIIPVAIYGIK